MKFEVDSGDCEGYNAQITFNAGVGSGVVNLEELAEFDFHAVAPSTSLCRLKVNEADYFLKLSKTMQHHEAAVHYNISAFATAAAGFFDVLTNETLSHPSYRRKIQTWIASKKEAAKRSESFIEIVKFRNRMVHQGHDPPALSIGLDFKQHLNGARTLMQTVSVERLGRQGPYNPFEMMEEVLAMIRKIMEVAEKRGYIKSRSRPGHGVVIRCLEETSLGSWESKHPSDFAMFGNRIPEFGFGEWVHGPSSKIDT